MAMVIGSTIGLIASFLQIMDKISLLKDSGVKLACNISDSLNCTTVLNSDQASVLGPPNALISTIMFCFLLAIALVGLTGGTITKKMRLVVQFLALFTLCFGSWFLYQSIFVIQSLCIYCMFNISGLLLINAGWLRINYSDISDKNKFTALIKKLVDKDFDILIWLTIAVLIVISAMSQFM
jgi:uncharacterized membrane protein